MVRLLRYKPSVQGVADLGPAHPSGCYTFRALLTESKFTCTPAVVTSPLGAPLSSFVEAYFGNFLCLIN